MIQLLVNRHNEPESTVKALLDSISGQQGAPEHSVIIGDDGSDSPLSEGLLSRYPFVRYVTLEHMGMSATRNALMDMADGEYLMFLDADDIFVSMIGLHVISRHFDFDVFCSEFLEERRRDGELLGYVPRRNDPFFLHGKCFRRQFLVDNDIRWDDSMQGYGDPVFLWQAISLSQRTVYCDTAFYLWRYNPNSLCRSEPDHFVKTYHESMHEFSSLIANFVRRGRTDLASRFATLMAYDAYFMMHRDTWQDNPKATYILLDCANRYRDLITIDPRLYREKQGNYRWVGPDQGVEGVKPWLDGLQLEQPF